MTPEQDQALREQCRKEAEDRYPYSVDRFTWPRPEVGRHENGIDRERQAYAAALYSERKRTMDLVGQCNQAMQFALPVVEAAMCNDLDGSMTGFGDAVAANRLRDSIAAIATYIQQSTPEQR